MAFPAELILGGLRLSEETSAGGPFVAQSAGVLAVASWSAGATFVLVKLVQAIVPLRVSTDDEIEGLDIVVHGERAYERLAGSSAPGPAGTGRRDPGRRLLLQVVP